MATGQHPAVPTEPSVGVALLGVCPQRVPSAAGAWGPPKTSWPCLQAVMILSTPARRGCGTGCETFPVR